MERKKIFDMRGVGGLRVHVEPKLKSTFVSQCHNCQQFGHVQRWCTSQVCFLCSAPRVQELSPAPGQPAKCCNRGGYHPTFFTSCPHHPNNVRACQEEVKLAKFQAATRVSGVSYSAVAGSVPSPGVISEKSIDAAVEKALARILPKNLERLHG